MTLRMTVTIPTLSDAKCIINIAKFWFGKREGPSQVAKATKHTTEKGLETTSGEKMEWSNGIALKRD